jgi:hypothetical protein
VRLFLIALALTGCAPLPSQTACLVPSQKPMVVAELFFGRSIPGRPPLTDAEWADFAAQVITPNFPDGFTVSDGEGQWRNPKTGVIGREQSKILLIAADPSADLAPRLTAVIDSYRTRFRQLSVGLLTSPVCGSF